MWYIFTALGDKHETRMSININVTFPYCIACILGCANINLFFTREMAKSLYTRCDDLHAEIAQKNNLRVKESVVRVLTITICFIEF